MKKRKLLALCLVPALLAGCAAPAGVTDLSRQFEAGARAPGGRPGGGRRHRHPGGGGCLQAAREPGRTPCSPRCLWPWPCP